MTGTVLKNRYCILEQIGKGGNASVYLARDMELGVLRAVKELPLSGKREARLLASMEHPSLPQMVDYEENDRNCYIIMEYVKGENLGEALRAGEKFTVKEVVDIGFSLAQVLGYLHGRKPPVFYGDLKPDNLMLSENGRIFLVDLGSAVAGYGKAQRICTGTQGFAAPEQYKGQVSAASDIYSLGKTLTVLLGDKTFLQFLIHPELAIVLMRCCLREEKLRYQSMEILEKKFQKLKKGGGAGRTVWILGSVFVCLLLAVCMGMVITGKKEEPDFYDRLTEVTELYYREEFKTGKPEERKRLCEEAEMLLKDILQQYHGKRENRQIMRLLAGNSEYAGDEEQAAFYYEQILQYDGSFREVYGEYGMFLLRTGQKDGCMELWEDYLQKEKDGGLENGESLNLEIWEKMMIQEAKAQIDKNVLAHF